MRKAESLSIQFLTLVARSKGPEIASDLESLLLAIKKINLDQVLNPGFLSRVWTTVLTELSLSEGGLENISFQIAAFTRTLEEAKLSLILENEVLETMELEFTSNLKEVEAQLQGTLSADAKAISDHLCAQALSSKQSLSQLLRLRGLNLQLLNKIFLTLEETLPLWKGLILAIVRANKMLELDQSVKLKREELSLSVGEVLRTYHESFEKKKAIQQELLDLERQLLGL